MFTQSNTTILGQGLIETGMNLTGQVELLIKAVIVVAVILGVLVTGYRAKWAAGAVLPAILVGAAVIWGVANINVISDRVGEDLGQAAVVQTIPATTLN